MKYTLLSHLYYQDEKAYQSLYTQRFEGETTTHLDFMIHSSPAFFCLNSDIYSLSTRIYALDKQILNLRRALPEVAINQFARKCLVDEIVLTNNIEGIHSTRHEIDGVLKSIETDNQKKRFYGLVKKYDMLSQEQISLQSCEDIRRIYDELVLPEVAENDAADQPDGKLFRKGLAEVANEAQKVIHKGVYPEEKIISTMEQALSILNSEEIPSLIRLSIYHYLFGYIHPFYDGNGRMARFISSYLLAEELEDLIAYRLSYTIKENLRAYYEAFKLCNDEKNKGDLTPFIQMFLSVICEAMERLYEALDKRSKDLFRYSEMTEQMECFDRDLKDNLCYVLIQARLFSENGVTKKELCRGFNISASTLGLKLKVVRAAGFLKEKQIGHEKYYEFDIDRLAHENQPV